MQISRFLQDKADVEASVAPQKTQSSVSRQDKAVSTRATPEKPEKDDVVSVQREDSVYLKCKYA